MILPVPLACISAAPAVTIDLVPVGNAGSPQDTRYGRNYSGDPTDPLGYGGVAYAYRIGRYEVTAGQYCEFLNAVARTDTYGLYNTYMDTVNNEFGCSIKRTGTSGSYTYSVASNWANRPVNFVSWGGAARFANYMRNGQPSGTQNASTTEDGSYALNGATSGADLLRVTRKANATWVIPGEDEWYKAAYYDPNKPAGAGYWDYPTQSNTAPSNVLSSTGTNNANFRSGSYTIGAPYYRTEAGTFAGCPGPYGTFDQGGNVFEWNEAVLDGTSRGLRGGSFGDFGAGYLYAAVRYSGTPAYEYKYYGFCLACVPEPATIAMLALGGLALLRRRK